MGSSIVVAGQRFDIDHPVVTFEDSGGYNAYLKHRTDDPTQLYPTHPAPGMEKKEGRYRERHTLEARTLTALKRTVRQVVVHLDGCLHSKMCFDVLHNQHGLSVHFLVDNDGTIYQTLDLADCAFHAAGVNEHSVGIELANRGDAARFPGVYKDGTRETVTCMVHDTLFLAYDYTRAQYDAMTKLSAALARILDLPLAAPRGSDGSPHRGLMPDPGAFAGFIGHYNITGEKWDPGPWDFQRMFRRVASRMTLPLTVPERLRGASGVDPARFTAETELYYQRTETLSPGRFPLGPEGESRLWHAGVHLLGGPEAPLYAPLPGRVVAARSSPPSAYGSTSFVLIRHTLDTDREVLPFYTLYFHVRPEAAGPDAPPWLSRTPEVGDDLASGRTLRLDTAIDAGELLGRLGEAGPADAREPQVHFAVFAEEDVVGRVDPDAFRRVDGVATGRFAPSVLVSFFDRAEGGQPPDGLVSRREILEFFRASPRREELRALVVRHLSEWTVDGWEAAIEGARDFRALSAAERRALYEAQIRPTLWWNESIARHTGLPLDGVVHSYHPIGFLAWYEAYVRRRSEERSRGIMVATGKEVVSDAALRFKLDSESTLHMTDATDVSAPPPRRGLTLDEMLEGYGE